MSRRTWIAGALVLALAAGAQPASAQWTRVTETPPTTFFSVWANGDTLLASADSTLQISTDAGATWHETARLEFGVQVVLPARMRNGRIYAGTIDHGVLTSDDLGATWAAFNQGLVGGFQESQLDISDLAFRGDSLYAATLGAGVYVRRLAASPTAWSPFGAVFEPEQASAVNSVTLGGVRLLACAGTNGEMFRRDPGEPEWTISPLNNTGLAPGIGAFGALFTGTGWVVGTNAGVFCSTLGSEPWTPVNMHLGTLDNVVFAHQGARLFGAFDIPPGAVIEFSADDGATWQVLDGLGGVYVFGLAMVGDELYAARVDGLWRRPTATVAVAGGGAAPAGASLQLAVAGAQPVGDVARLRFAMPAAGMAALEVFDVRGRRVSEPMRQFFAPGVQELSWDAHALPPGVYLARLSTARAQEAIRLVRVRR